MRCFGKLLTRFQLEAYGGGRACIVLSPEKALPLFGTNRGVQNSEERSLLPLPLPKALLLFIFFKSPWVLMGV